MAVKSGDLAHIVNLKEQRPLTDQEKLYVLDQHSGYKFPSRTINECKRHFQRKWLSMYNGLVYSESTNGGYCKYCVLFARCSPKVPELAVFVSKPFKNWNIIIIMYYNAYNVYTVHTSGNDEDDSGGSNVLPDYDVRRSRESGAGDQSTSSVCIEVRLIALWKFIFPV